MNKYFLTCDLENTSKITNGIIPVLSEEISKIRDNISYIINNSFGKNICEVYGYNEICNFFQKNKKSEEFIISLDNGIYVEDADYYFDSTRVYNSKNSIIENPKDYTIKMRNGKNLTEQVYSMINTFEKSNKKKIIICDDGIFSGDTLKDVAMILKQKNIDVNGIRVALNFSGKKDLDGIKIEGLRNENNCIDWIDERDFFYGVNMSGASFSEKEKIFGIPYIANQKIAQKKASIPELNSKNFCKTMIGENIQFWEKMTKINKKDFLLKDIPRIGYLLNKYGKNENIINILKQEQKII